MPQFMIIQAVTISRIAHFDWPENWPSLFDGLMEFLKSNNKHQVHGVLSVLSGIVKDDITDENFPLLAPILVPELYRVVCSPQVRTSLMQFQLKNFEVSIVDGDS
jgi:importin-9